MYECPFCGAKAVIWDADFDFSDFGYEGDGVIHAYHCTECGEDIEYPEGDIEIECLIKLNEDDLK